MKVHGGDYENLGPHLDRAAISGFFWACRRRMFESQQIEAIVAPTAKHSETRKSLFTGPGKGCLFFVT